MNFRMPVDIGMFSDTPAHKTHLGNYRSMAHNVGWVGGGGTTRIWTGIQIILYLSVLYYTLMTHSTHFIYGYMASDI